MSVVFQRVSGTDCKDQAYPLGFDFWALNFLNVLKKVFNTIFANAAMSEKASSIKFDTFKNFLGQKLVSLEFGKVRKDKVLVDVSEFEIFLTV